MALIDGLVAAGVRHAVISPGSRSTPLTLACSVHPALRTWVQVDERSAAFFALGLAKADGEPALLVATSGSAAGHWLPAIIEASQGAVPLLLLSADRPPELQACGANQTVDQLKLYGGHVRAFHALPVAEGTVTARSRLQALAAQAADQSRWPVPGPVHLNVPFREPLLPSADPPMEPPAGAAVARVGYPRLQPDSGQMERLARLMDGRPGLIVCGAGHWGTDFPGAVTALAARLGAPLLADPLADLRCGSHDRSHVLCCYDAFLRRHAAGRVPSWVLRFGALPVSKALQGYLRDCGAAMHAVVEPHGRWPDPLHQATELVHADAAAVCAELAVRLELPGPAEWWAAFAAEEQRAANLLAEPTVNLWEGEVVPALVQRLPPDSLLFSGSSMPIRELDSFLGSAPRALRVVANRGASGIDGNISTLLGLAAAGGRRGATVGLLGDLACYHDMNGLLAARGLRVTLVVLNNGGGAIFGYLPQARLAGFADYWLTPTGLDLGQVAALYGLAHHRVHRPEALGASLDAALAAPGPALVEVMLDRAASLARHQAYWAAVAAD